MKSTRTIWLAGAALGIALCARMGAAAAPQASFAGLGLPDDALGSVAAQVSPDGGTVVGAEIFLEKLGKDEFGEEEDGEEIERAVVWAGGKRRVIPMPANTVGRASGVSINGGTVVGTFHRTAYFRANGKPMSRKEWDRLWNEDDDEDDSGDEIPDIEENWGPYRWTKVVGFQPLPMPEGAEQSGGIAVSADGTTVVGYMDSEDGFQAFRWTTADGTKRLGFFPGGIESRALAVSRDGSVIVGFGNHADGIRAFRWTAKDGLQNLGVLPGCKISRAAGVSADGNVVVGAADVDFRKERAFRWTAAEGMVELTAPPKTYATVATAVSADGSIVVGQMIGEKGEPQAFVWDATHGMRSVKSVLEAANVDVGTWRLDIAMGISADGRTVVGSGVNPDDKGEGWRAELPAP